MDINTINSTRKEITAQVKASEIEAQKASVLSEFVKIAKIQGFREGKAPLNLVEKKYAKDIAQEVEKAVLSDLYKQLEDNKDFEIYTLVEHSSDPIVVGQDATVKFVVDIRPSFDLPASLEFEVEKKSEEPTEEEINQAVEHARGQHSKYNEVDRPVLKGDFVRLSYEGKIEDKLVDELLPNNRLFCKQTNTWEEAGNEKTPGVQGIVQGLIGLNKGDKKQIEHTFAADYEVKEVAGKTAIYDVEVFEIREKIMPQLDEEFFKAVSAKDLEDFKAQIKKEFEFSKKQGNEQYIREQILKQLDESVKLDLPESAVETQTNQILTEFMQYHMNMGATQDQFEAQKDKLHESAAVQAKARVKMRLILDKIAKENKITIDDKDISNRIMQEAYQTRTKPEEIVKLLRKDRSALMAIRDDTLFIKALNFLADKAKVKEAK